jgi:hypothetical protein
MPLIGRFYDCASMVTSEWTINLKQSRHPILSIALRGDRDDKRVIAAMHRAGPLGRWWTTLVVVTLLLATGCFAMYEFGHVIVPQALQFLRELIWLLFSVLVDFT